MNLSDDEIRATLETINRQSAAIAVWSRSADVFQNALLDIRKSAQGAPAPKNPKLLTSHEEIVQKVIEIVNGILT